MSFYFFFCSLVDNHTNSLRKNLFDVFLFWLISRKKLGFPYILFFFVFFFWVFSFQEGTNKTNKRGIVCDPMSFSLLSHHSSSLFPFIFFWLLLLLHVDGIVCVCVCVMFRIFKGNSNIRERRVFNCCTYIKLQKILFEWPFRVSFFWGGKFYPYCCFYCCLIWLCPPTTTLFFFF